MFALVIVRLTSALVTVRSMVLTGQAVHDIEVIGTVRTVAITVFSKITGVDRLSAWRSRNSDLKQKQNNIQQQKNGCFPKYSLLPLFSAVISYITPALSPT